MLDKINEILAAIPGTRPCGTVPHLRLSSNVLQENKVFLIDDSPGVFEIYVPPIMSATNGNAEFMLHEHHHSLEDIVEVVKKTSPNIALVDFYLSGARGSDVCYVLSQTFPDLILFGFSSLGMDPKITKAFVDAGAKASIQKTKDAEWTLESLLSWLV